MTSIKIDDLNLSDSELMCQLSDQELLEINGGGWFKAIFGGACVAVGTALVATGVAAPVGGTLIAGGFGLVAVSGE
ncbi:MAG: bacteriocin [Hydrococcus sp. SU_1_0]|nr:bacteriocin [Hydrococcus sp. SU_1_0]NJL64374.1 bacteriocin [Candidatus Methylacidiphilales bacterium]NJR16218.1 bacteriocin [Calothrix sp. CSU_2_0]NJR76760.1 bacteriocin [Scytonema sp. CRU_2_7]